MTAPSPKPRFRAPKFLLAGFVSLAALSTLAAPAVHPSVHKPAPTEVLRASGVGETRPAASAAGGSTLPLLGWPGGSVTGFPKPGRVRTVAALAPQGSPVVAATKQDAFVTDADGDGKADPGDVLRYTVTIANTGAAEATGVVFEDTIDPNTTLVPGSVEATPVARNDSYSAVGNVPISPAAPAGLLANDGDPDGGSLTVTAINTAGTQGSVTFNPNGSFTFNPTPGFEGATTFTYTVTDGDGNTDTATATITVSGMIWFVNGAAGPGGDGRLGSPFNSLTLANGFTANAARQAGDAVFLYSGTYAGGITLLNNEKLVGQGATASLAAVLGLAPPAYSAALPSTGGARPVLTSGATNVTVGQGNLIRGVNLDNTAGTPLAGATFGTLTVADTSVTNTSGVAVSLNGGTLAASFTSVSASGGANGIALTNTTGSFAVTGTGAAGTGGTIQNTTGANGTSGGIGVYMSNAQGVSLSYMNISNHANYAIFGTNVAGFALSNSVVGGTNGQYVVGNVDTNREGSVAFFNLTGTATFASSTISGGAQDNVKILNDSGTCMLSFTGCTIQNNLASDGKDGLYLKLTSTANVTANVSGNTFNHHKGNHIAASAEGSSVLDITINNNTANGDRGGNHGGTSLGDGITVTGSGANTAHGSATVRYTISGNTILGAVTPAIAVSQSPYSSTAASMSGTVSNNVIGTDAGPTATDSGSAQGSGISVDAAGRGAFTIAVTGNTIKQYNNYGILLSVGDGGNLAPGANATITNNTISSPATSPLFPNKNGIHLNHGRISTASIDGTADRQVSCVEISNNSIVGSGSGGAGGTDFRLRQRIQTTVRLPGYAGAANDDAAVVAFAQGKNAVGGTPTGSVANSVATGGFGYVGGAPCAAPAKRADVLRAAEGEGPGGEGVAALGNEELSSAVQAAILRFIDTGISDEEVARLRALSFTVADLPSGELASSGPDGVAVDRTGAGHGWFIDATPLEDSEFDKPVAAKRLDASGYSDAHGRMDLMTAVMHELGRALGHAKAVRGKRGRGLMKTTLPAGVRRLPAVRRKDAPGAARVTAPVGLSPADVRPVSWRDDAEDAARPKAAVVRGAVRGHTTEGTSPKGPARSGETITLNVGTLAAGESVTITFDVAVDDPLSTPANQISNQGAVSGLNFASRQTDDPGVGGSSDPTVTPLDAGVDLRLTKSDGGATTTPGGTVAYTLSYENTGSQNATGVVITETLPTGASFNSGASTAGWADQGGGAFTFAVGSVAAGGSGSVTFAVTANDPVAAGVTQLSNTATIADDGASGLDGSAANNSATDTTPVTAAPDLQLTKSDGGADVQPGATVAYTLAYTNVGNQGAAGVVITETLPAGTTFNAGASTASWVAQGGGVYTLTVGALAGGGANGSATFAVTVDAGTAGGTVVSNTATIADDGANGADPTPANNTATDTTLVAAPDLQLTKTDGGSAVVPGGTVAYTLAYTNAGSSAVTGAVITETLPAGTTFNASASTPGWAAQGGGGYTFAVGAVAAGGSGSVTFAVTVSNPVAAGVNQISNTATIADDGANGADLNPANNSASDTTPVTAAPDLRLSKSDGGAGAQPGATVAYTLAYSNVGNQGAAGVVITENLPANAAFNAGASTAGWAAQGGGVYTLAVGAVAAGGSGSVTFAVTVSNPVPSLTVISNTASVADDGANGADPAPADNTATDTTPVNTTPTVAAQPVTLAQGNSLAAVHVATVGDPDQASGTLVVTAAPAGGTGVTLTNLAVGAAGAVTANVDATCTATTSSFTLTVTDSLGASSTATLTVTVTPSPAPSITAHPVPRTVCAGSSATFSVTATGAGLEYQWRKGGVDIPGANGPSFTVSSANTGTVGSYDVVVTGTCGSVASNPAALTLETTPPTISCPANITVGNDPGQCSAVVTFATPAATDGCGVASVVCSPASGSTFARGTTPVTCTATDTNGNTASCTFSVTVNDTQAPAIACPANLTVPADPGQCSAVVNYPVSASDNCPGVTVVCSPAAGSSFPVGTTAVVCTAADASGNSSQCGFTVTVADTQPPTLTCPADVVAVGTPAQDGTLQAVVAYAAPTVADNCPGVTVTCSPASGSTFPEGVTMVTCTATDAAGNAATCAFTVTVAPEFDLCLAGDGNGDSFSMILDPASASYGFWRYRVAATGQVFSGYAEYVSNTARRLTAYDRDDRESTLQVQVTYGARGSGTVTVVDRATRRRFVLRDRNTANTPPCQ
jgi:uncharacterized repeat protein (TIGR01451 family)